MNKKKNSNIRQAIKNIVTLSGTLLAILIFGNATNEVKELIGPAKSFLESFFLPRNHTKDYPLNTPTSEDTTSIKI